MYKLICRIISILTLFITKNESFLISLVIIINSRLYFVLKITVQYVTIRIFDKEFLKGPSKGIL